MDISLHNNLKTKQNLELKNNLGGVLNKMKYFAVDRKEGIYTILENTQTHKLYEVKSSQLPPFLKDGDIVNVDLTAEYKGFHGDASRMFMIGNVTPRARELVQTCQDALNAAISICAPGVPLSEIGKTIEAVVKPHGFSISRDFVGHGIGKVMHDEPQIYHFYDKRWDKVKMVPGLVFTIEPMINTGSAACKIDPDGWTARTVDGGLSAQWEHTLGITEDGVTIFTERMV